MKSKDLTFAEKCYQALSLIPRGKVTTYRLLAHALGTRAYRAVGSAMRKNPNVPKVPCHRVVRSDGFVGEYVRGTKKKIILLKKEGILVINGKIPNLKEVLFRF